MVWAERGSEIPGKARMERGRNGNVRYGHRIEGNNGLRFQRPVPPDYKMIVRLAADLEYGRTTLPFWRIIVFFSNIRHFKIEVALQGSMIYRRQGGGREVLAAWAIHQGV